MDKSGTSESKSCLNNSSDGTEEGRLEASLLRETNNKQQSSPLMSVIEPELDYRVPSFAVNPSADNESYGFEIIKNGVIINRVNFSKRKAATFLVIGRLPSCDIYLEHPTISRHHCILQYGVDLTNRSERGWHIYDLNSTHGTKLNKKKIPPKQFIRIRVGYVMQFGGSTRILTLFGPKSDTEAEWECSPMEMRRECKPQELHNEVKEAEKETSGTEKESDGIMWGMDFDDLTPLQAYEEDEMQNREEKYNDEPLKVLSRFFEREGFDMEFTYEDIGVGHNHKWTCFIELPVTTATGLSLTASSICSGTKKEAQTICAFNACKILDKHGILFRSNNEGKKKARNLADNDYYDSDEDIYFDRTGQIETSREKRRQRALETKDRTIGEAETFETLTEKIATLDKELHRVENQLIAISTKVEEETNEDTNDFNEYSEQFNSYNGHKDNISVKMKKSILRQRLVFLKHKKERLEKLAEIAKPVELPKLKILSSSNAVDTRAGGSLSAATMKKLMKMRQAKVLNSEEKRRDKAAGMVLPPDAFIRETDDTIPFIAEIEDEEDGKADVKSSIGRINNAERIGDADEKSSSHIQTGKTESSLEGDTVLSNAATTGTNLSQGVFHHVPRHMDSAAVNVETSQYNQLEKRKCIRTRDGNSSKRQKVCDYGEGTANSDDYVMWLPPENQKGDGTNALNAVFAGRY